jgi:hypothetical protein
MAAWVSHFYPLLIIIFLQYLYNFLIYVMSPLIYRSNCSLRLK